MTSEPSSSPIVPVRTGYDRWSKTYDVDGNPLVALEEEHFDGVLGPVAGLRVLDLGCGTGRHAVRLARAGADVEALDFSEGMLARARESARGTNVRFRQHDLHERLPYSGASFDRVVSGLVLEHLRELPPFFVEIARVLVPGSHAVVSTIHPAMRLRDVQARFTDPGTGEVIRIDGRPQEFSPIVLAALGAGLRITHLSEHAPDAVFAARVPRAEKYVGWPLLMLLRVVR